MGQKTGVCDHLNLSILTQVISRKCHNTNHLHSELKSLWTYISFSIASETWTYQAFIFNLSAPSNKCVNISSPLRGLKSKLISLINCCSCSKTRSLTSAQSCKVIQEWLLKLLKRLSSSTGSFYELSVNCTTFIMSLIFASSYSLTFAARYKHAVRGTTISILFVC